MKRRTKKFGDSVCSSVYRAMSLFVMSVRVQEFFFVSNKLKIFRNAVTVTYV